MALKSKRFRIVACSFTALVLVALSGVGVYFGVHSLLNRDTGVTQTPGGAGTLPEIGEVSQMTTDEEAYRVSIKLSEGQSQPQSGPAVPVATGVPLSEEEIAQILKRLPEVTQEAGDQVDFRLALDPIPPPRPGETVEESFPPPPPTVVPDAVESGPLQVLRFSPEGEIPVAPFLSVTFNQPMVPLTTLENLSAKDVPVKIEPALEGTWRWLGTRTLTFEYDSELIDRLPKATLYNVTIPAGTVSAVGGKLAREVMWSFSTPPPKMTSGYPSNDSQPLEPLFLISFDQRIDPKAVLETIKVTADGKAVSIVMAKEDEIQEDKQVSRMVKYAQEGRWLAFRSQEPLPADAGISVTIGPGTPSAEGPLVTSDAQSFSFRTYAPLRIENSGCSNYDDNCRPLNPFYINFNNPLDANVYEQSMVTIEPELPGAVIDIIGSTITIRGATKGQTTYTVTLSADIQDVYGQKLGKKTTLKFKVGSADPILIGPGQIFVTLDPAAEKPVYSVYAINYSKLLLKIYAVQPSDWPAYKLYLQEYQRTDNPPKMPGRLVKDETISVESAADTLTEVDIDLSSEMDGKYGHFIVVIEPPKSLFKKESERAWQIVRAWVQVTQIGLDAFNDQSDLVLWATNLKDGAPLDGVKIEAGSGGYQAETDKDGTARIPVPDGATYLVASKGADKALLPRSTYYWGDDSWYSWTPSDELHWYVFDDRQMYKPGEEVHIKGWLRRVGGKQDGDVGLVGNAVSAVNYRITESQGNELVSGRVEVNALGGFDFAFTIPEATNLGYAQVSFTAEGGLGGMSGSDYYHSFQIQEFRRPEFEVSARNETTGPYFVGDQAVVAVDANYYAGGPLPNADVTWQVSTSPGSYSPPNWSEFTFGTWQPWWYYYGPVSIESSYGGKGTGYGGTVYETFSGKTDAAGTHYLQLTFEESTQPKPLSVIAEATVMDVNRQAWASSTSLLVHPADLYVGLRSERYFVERGTPLKIELIVTDLDGNPVADRPIQVQAARLEWKYGGVGWHEEEVDVQQCTVGSTLEPVSCTFETPVGGTYRITAVITDEMGRKNQSQFTRWVSGGKQPVSRKVEQETATLIPDKDSYQPGDVAEILVQSPFNPAEGLLTVSRSGILYTQRFLIEDGTITLKVPIEEAHIPNLNIQVDLVGAAARTDDQGEAISGIPPRPAYATAQMNLSIPPLQRVLALDVTPAEKELEPGGETTLKVVVKDADGKPVSGAELAVVVVDEAVLALTNYQLTDPIDAFYYNRSSNLSSLYSRQSIILIDPQKLSDEAQAVARNALDSAAVEKMVEAPMAEEGMMLMATAAPASIGGAEAEQPAIRVRTDFNPLATFAPAVHTDANGEALVEIKLPDNLTRYRVMVVAVDNNKKFGMAETNLVARLPLMVRPSAPRFLNFGDQFELSVVLQNQTGVDMVVDVAVQTANLLIVENAGLRVTVPARDRIEVRFPMQTDKAGTARVQIAAVSGSYADAATVELPVYTPATTEAFATYGVVDEGAVAQPIEAPGDVFPQYGGLEIDTSSTALQALTDAVIYLSSYPYECTEQIASRILAIAALRDVLDAFDAEGLPSPAALEAAVLRDIERLRGLQRYDGGWPYWRLDFDSIPFNTIHAAYALQEAKMMGFEVPESTLQNALEYLRNIEDHYPSWYGTYTRRTLSSYALFVRNVMGDRDVTKALKLYNEATLDGLSLESIGWLWPVLQDAPEAQSALEAIRQYVNNRVVETAGAANFTTYYDDQTYLLLSSDRRTDAILLDALIVDNPQSDLIPKVVNGLLAHRTKGRWGNTQENVFVLLALNRYFDTYESQTPDFVARIWLGDTYAGSHEYQGYTTERHETDIPMAYLVDETLGGGGTQDLIISKEGPGRLYYRLGLRYAPTDLELDPIDMGFVVTRRYEAVDDPEDVYQDEAGIWHIKAGARVRVRLTMVADNRRYHVALVDPLPAGLEIVNPALAVSGSVPQDPSATPYRYYWWYWSWYEHQNMRDERAEAFTTLLWEGVYEYTYVARATTPGRFIVPPTKAEEMYSPEVFGRSSSDIVIVDD
jgi:uncharacterized protein YfaS (alpha-2-macroglobulin family)